MIRLPAIAVYQFHSQTQLIYRKLLYQRNMHLSCTFALNSNPSTSAAAFPLAFDGHFQLNGPEKINPLVVVHGLFGHKQNWRGVGKALQKVLKNNVFVVDMRNHGESHHVDEHTYPLMAADLRKFIELQVLPKSSYKSAFLLGHSMGGKVVAEFALNAENASLIEKLVIEDVAPQRSSHSGAGEFKSYIHAMRSVDLNGTRSEINTALKDAIPDGDVRAFLLTNLFKPRSGPFYWRCNLSALEKNMDHILGYSVGEENKKCTVSTLFLSGAESVYLNESDRPALRVMFPNAKFEVIPKAGHWVHSQQPERFIRSMVKFLQSGYFTYEN